MACPFWRFLTLQQHVPNPNDPPALTDEESAQYAEYEKEHLGDAEKGTGIYAPLLTPRATGQSHIQNSGSKQ